VPRPGIRDWLLLVSLAAMWGTAFLATAVAVRTVTPATVAAGRLAVAAILLGATARAAGVPRPPARRLWLHFLALALIGNALPFYLISWGQERVPSSLAGILMAVMPLTVLVMAHFLVEGERLSPRRGAGFALGFAGIAVLMGPAALRGLGAHDQVVRQAAILAGALCYAGNAILTRRLPELPALAAAAPTLLLAAAIAVPAALALEAPWRLDPSVASAAAVFWLGLVATALATVVYFRLVASAGATFAALINYLIPLVAVVAGVLVLDERPGWNAYAALGLVLGALALAQGLPGRAPSRQTAPNR
jgi:drug/metabolite transporter (DMT)-like permease